MATPYICLTCRAKILLSKLRQARPISYTAVGRNTVQTRHGPERRTGGLETAPARGRYSGKELRPEQLLDYLNDPRLSGSGRESHSAPRRQSRVPVNPDDRNIGTRPKNHNAEQRRQNGGSLPQEMEEKIHLLLACVNTRDLPRAWEAFTSLAHMCSHVSNDRIRAAFDQHGIIKAINAIAWASIREWLDGLSTTTNTPKTLPTPFEVFSTFRLLRTPKASFYRPALWQATSGLYELDLDQIQLTVALRDLLNLWRLSMAARLVPELSPEQDPSEIAQPPRKLAVDDECDWGFLPPSATFTPVPQERRTHSMFEDMLNMLLPGPQARPGRRIQPRLVDYASSAILTLDMLRFGRPPPPDSGPTSTNLTQALPFIELLDTILKIAPSPPVPISLRQKLLSDKAPKLLGRYQTTLYRMNLPNASENQPFILNAETSVDSDLRNGSRTAESGRTDDLNAERIQSTDLAVDAGADPDQQHQTPIQRFTLLNISRLGRALEQRNTTMVDKIKMEIYAYAGSHGDNPTALPLELFEALMRSYMSLRNLAQAGQVWKYMVDLGYKPTTRTYTIMMRGALSVRDISGMEVFWRSMRQNNLQPDEYAWSVRIFGFLKQAKALQQGLQALSDMGREWFAAAQAQNVRDTNTSQLKQAVPEAHSAADLIRKFPGPVNGVPRPNLVVMNSAISALASTNDKEILKVLTWGRSFGIEPDVITYNTLLNVAMRHSQAEEALKILQRMHARGVQANSVTWTVLLTAMFEGGFLENISAEEQQKKVLILIDSLYNKEIGMTGIDEKGYALIIDRLLKNYSNAAAASAVVAHMINNGREPTAQIYTILVTSYFQRRPRPDFEAVEVLWKQIQARNNGWGAHLDNVFYDRMIEGYAVHHRSVGIQPAMDYLKRSRDAGHKSSWIALEAVARALAERNDWLRLKALVDDIRASLRNTKGAIVHSFGQQKFWELIVETGILKDEGITRAEQLLPAEPRTSELVGAQAAAY